MEYTELLEEFFVQLDPLEDARPGFEGLEIVQESEETNMLDYQAVQDIAIRMGYPETALWVREHRHEYCEGIFRGFLSTE
jgi:hypothetical protein